MGDLQSPGDYSTADLIESVRKVLASLGYDQGRVIYDPARRQQRRGDARVPAFRRAGARSRKAAGEPMTLGPNAAAGNHGPHGSTPLSRVTEGLLDHPRQVYPLTLVALWQAAGYAGLIGHLVLIMTAAPGEHGYGWTDAESRRKST